MDKQRILDEIGRTAKENGGVPLGVDRFASATGIGEAAWRGRFWARWNDAVREAGLTPNTLRPKTDEDALMRPLADFIRELGRYPTVSEMRLRKRQDDVLPNHKVLERRGSRQEIVKRLLAFCERTDGYFDMIPLCQAILASTP